MATTDYQVKLDVFEGPLDLLLYLVRKEEVELYDLSLERLTRQYLDYLARVPQPDLDLAGDFVAMAAHLIYLKSRRLLPPDEQAAAADRADAEDPRWELIRQLIEYKMFKQAASHLQRVETARYDLFPRLPEPPARPAPEEDALAGALALGDVGVLDLLRAFQRMLHRLEQPPDAPVRTIVEENFTVADKIEHVRRLALAAGGGPVGFTDLFSGASSRVEMVVTFLAVLELVRLKQLRVVQRAAFEEFAVYVQPEPAAAVP